MSIVIDVTNNGVQTGRIGHVFESGKTTRVTTEAARLSEVSRHPKLAVVLVEADSPEEYSQAQQEIG